MIASRFKRLSAIPLALLVLSTLMNPAVAGRGHHDDDDDRSVFITVFAPGIGDVAGVGSRAFLVDIALQFDGDLASTGATVELTGPTPIQGTGPFPGTFGMGANKDHFPSLVVLLSSTLVGAGPGQNIADLFNINTVTNRDESGTEIWSTWIAGAPNVFGKVGENTPSRLFIAVVEGTAPDVVLDMDNNGIFNKKDLRLMGYKVISNTPKVDFVINGS
jgi:hypothetical protein